MIFDIEFLLLRRCNGTKLKKEKKGTCPIKFHSFLQFGQLIFFPPKSMEFNSKKGIYQILINLYCTDKVHKYVSESEITSGLVKYIINLSLIAILLEENCSEN